MWSRTSLNIKRLLSRGALHKRDRYDLASIALFVLLLILIGATFVDYGITWDEPVQNGYGRNIARYYLLLLRGRYEPPPVENSFRIYLYGGGFDTVANVLNVVSPFGEYETRHLLNALVGLLGIIGCWKLARELGGSRVAFFSALLLAITPRYYGPMFNNPKDIPFAAGYIWAIYYILRALPHFPTVPRKILVQLGCAIGTTMAVRVGGVVLLGYVGL